MLRKSLYLTGVLALGAAVVHAADEPASAGFNPRAYSMSHATCKGTNRAKQQEVDIDLEYVNVNPEAKTAILMVHGWPSLWSSWSNQIQELEQDYHLIVPNLRGFGNSQHPGDVKASSTMSDYVGDLVCILEKEKVDKAICAGHDWGAQVCYEAVRQRPDIFGGVIGITVPYIPSLPPHYIGIENFLQNFPKLTYQVYFDKSTQTAIKELDLDIRRTVRATLRTVDSPPPNHYLTSNSSFLEAYNEVQAIPPVPFFSEEEETYFVEQYSIQGFQYTLGFYCHESRHASWKFAADQGNATIPNPVLAIYPDEDPVADWVKITAFLGTSRLINKLTTEVVKGAHWVHIENPEPVNKAIRSWLEKTEIDVEKSSAEPKSTNEHLVDEL
ncbi:alpha/beta-hydrolase [Pluteus cervinus]|uniref:Alpha/beta-hydrolase n=1 Tax=Pluteus cervinus TaxID=181527 RepID=A0ACD3AN30_9AGAR|nr:alpha/beta-hydrolase [Pluteus cervinus]